MAFSLPLPSWLLTLSITDDGGGDGGSGLRKIVRFSSRNEKTIKILKKTSERKEMKKDTDYYCWFLAGCWCIYIFYIDESYLCFENGSGCTVTNNLVTVRGSYYIFLLDLKLENNGTEREREFH